MKIRPYLTYNGECTEAIELYKEAFKTDVINLMLFSDMTNDTNYSIPEEYKNRVLQCTMRFGDDFIRLSDCGPGVTLNDQESERISLAVESDEKAVRQAFEVLAREGEIGIPLASTFYSSLAGVVFDKFGVMWNFMVIDEKKTEHKDKKAQHRWNKEVSEIEFYIDSRESKATIIWQKRNEMLLKKGAKLMKEVPLNKDGSLGFAAKMGTTLRNEHQDKIKDFTTTEDIIFKSVNEVGLFLYFGGTNSWLEMVDKNGKTIDEWTIVN